MPRYVQMPDGSVVEFPDNMSDENISNILRNSHPTQFEKERSGGEGGLKAFGKDILGAAEGVGRMMTSSLPTVAIQSGIRTGVNEVQRENEGRSLPYRIVAGVGENVTPLNVRGMEESANRGDTSGVIGHAAAGAGMTLAPIAAKPIMRSVGNAAEAAGPRLLNSTVGALKNDFAHGANPGEGYLAGGGKPALTMGGLADKASHLAENTGEKLGNLYNRSSAIIPAGEVEKTIVGPIRDLKNLQSGPGGSGVSPSVLNYEAQMIPTIDAADARGGFTPRQLFDEMKRPIARNTNWKDPSQFDLNTVRQQNVGGVGELLTDAVPEAKPLNRVYQGTSKLADRAAYRADTGQTPLSHIGRRALEGGLGAAIGYGSGHPIAAAIPMAIDTVPVKTSVAYGLYHGGRALNAVAPVTPSLAAPMAVASGLNKKKPDDEDQQ